MKIYTYDSKKKKPVLAGRIEGTHFVKDVDRGKHYFRLLQGYGIQLDVYRDLLDKHITDIVIHERDEKRALVSNIHDWHTHGSHGNWGAGDQITLSEKYMNKIPWDTYSQQR